MRRVGFCGFRGYTLQEHIELIDGMIKQIVLGQRALARLLITFIAKSRADDWIDPIVKSLRSVSSESVTQERVLTFIMPSLVRKLSQDKFRTLLENVRLEMQNIAHNGVTRSSTFLSWGLVDNACKFTMLCARYGVSGFEHAFVTLLHMGMEENKVNTGDILKDDVILGM